MAERILHVIGAMDRGGAETFIMNMYRAMDRERIQFDFLVHEQRTCDYDEEIAGLGGRLYRLPRYNGLNYIAYRSQCRALFSDGCDHAVVHGHIGSSAPIYLGEARRAGRYTIAHSHAQSYERGLSGLAFRMVSAPVRNVADYFMACSREAGIDRFGERVVDGDRFRVVPNGVDLDAFRFDVSERLEMRKKLGLDEVPVFGHVGRLTEVKNHAFLLRVFSRIRETLPNAVLLLIGRGPLDKELQQKAVSLGLGESVRFMGVREDVSCLLQAMDMLVFPSLKEGLPVAVVEAQATGLPCVLSTGIPDMAVATSMCKRLPLSLDADAWAAECVELYNVVDRSRRETISNEMRSSEFDIHNIADDLSKFYLSHVKHSFE